MSAIGQDTGVRSRPVKSGLIYAPMLSFQATSQRLGVFVSWQARNDGLQQMLRGVRDLVDGAVERFLVALRRLSVAADLADELERSGADLLVAGDLIVVT